MKTILAALVALAVGSAIVAPTQAASITITTGDGGQNWRDRDNDRWRENNWHDNGRHLGWYKQRRNHSMRRTVVRECKVTTHRYWRDGELVIERVRDCD